MLRMTGSGPLLVATLLTVASCSGGEPPSSEESESAPEGPVILFEESCCEDDLICQDGIWCNGIETCDCWGECGPGEAPCQHDPDPSDPCIEYDPVAPCINDRIDPAGEGYGMGHCQVTNICIDQPCETDADCDDGQWCNGQETCDPGTLLCVDGTSPCETGEVCFSSDSCNEDTDSCDLLPGYCYIGGTCIADGSRNPSNECEVCDPATDTSAYVVADGLACTSDGLSCTSDVCDATGTCTHDIQPAWCLIGGSCYGEGARNPVASCEACLTATSQTGWTDVPAGWACATDSYTCTDDVCDGLGVCTHPISAGWCLIGTTCVVDGSARPMYECQWCDAVTDQENWSDKPPGEPCTDDGHTCTTDQCDGAGTCTHPITSVAANDTCEGTSMARSGFGINMNWTGSGDTYCALDDYSSPCGGAGGPDTVHYFDIPTEYDTYRYRVMVGGPAGFDSIEHFYSGNAVVPGCAQPETYMDCNDNGASACWTSRTGAPGYDANDSCWYYGSTTGGRTFPNGRNYVVVDSNGPGDTYQVKVDRAGAPDVSDCNFPMPEIQMGGTFTGQTCDATTDWVIDMPYCVGSPYFWDCYYFNIYHINHAQPPFDTLNRGYVVTLDGELTPGGMDTVGFFSVNRCDSPWSLLSCDDDSYHYIEGSGRGSKIVTGRIPATRWGGIVVTSYDCYDCGNYTMNVEIDDDGDGIPNGSDASALMKGSTFSLAGGDGAKIIPRWPWADHGYSYDYPSNDIGACGREVYYAYNNTSAGADLTARAYPRIRGDVWAGQPANLWDMAIHVYMPTAGTVWCEFIPVVAAAGDIVTCDLWGAGEWEEARVAGASASTYFFAVDSSTCTPRGGWYSVYFR